MTPDFDSIHKMKNTRKVSIHRPDPNQLTVRLERIDGHITELVILAPSYRGDPPLVVEIGDDLAAEAYRKRAEEAAKLQGEGQFIVNERTRFSRSKKEGLDNDSY